MVEVSDLREQFDALSDYGGSETLIEKQEVKEAEQNREELQGVIGFVTSEFKRFETARYGKEADWLRSYEDYMGIPNSQRAIRKTEKSKVFIKIPKTKTLAAFGQINEVIFGAGKFPIGIYPTDKPEGVAKYAHAEENQEEDLPSSDIGFVGDGTRPDEAVPVNFLGKFTEVFKSGIDKLVPGQASPGKPQISPAKETAKAMELTIKDQLTEAHATTSIRRSVFEATLYGSGVIKGPYSYDEISPTWKIADDGSTEYVPTIKTSPRIDHISIWNFYPDPAIDDPRDAKKAIERHKWTSTDLRNLARLPHTNKEAIRRCIEMGPNYVKRSFENLIQDDNYDGNEEMTRFEGLEYWGPVDSSIALEMGIDLSSDITDLDEIQVNIIICNNEILRFTANPFQPVRLLYHLFPYEIDPHDIWGIGVPESMADTTMMMNGHVRMAIDNLALSGNLVFDIDESSLVAGQPMEVHPGKIFRRQSGAPGQAVYGIKFPSTTNENMMMFDRMRQLADEETSIPSYSHGQTKVQSTTRTASGMSMLMGAAALGTKTVVRNIDDYLLKPLGEDLYFWNMQFNPDPSIKGDLRVKALGTEALMQKEVQSQRILTFLQVTANPLYAPFVKTEPLLKELAYSMELDPTEVINNLEEAKIQAAIINQSGSINMNSSVEQPNFGSTGTGGGNITPAIPQQPGEQSFSGNTPNQGLGGTNEATTATPSA
jgi:hypothetical protein